MPKSKAHFTKELFAFLRELDANNERPWFDANKDRYLHDLREPMQRFITEFGKPLRKISPHFVADPRPNGGSMFRIYRDVRFSKDKRPFKTACTAQFRHEAGKDVHAPGFYVHLGIDEVFAGAGIWHPDGATLAKIRNAIVDNPARWKRILGAASFRKQLKLSGDSLKRPPRGFDPDHPLIEDLKRKDFIVTASFNEKLALSPAFLDRFTEVCRAGKPLVKFLTEALELPF